MNRLERLKRDIYHIRVKGTLDEKWSDWFGGFAMVTRRNGETLLAGAVTDQSELHAVLDRIHRLGLPLLLVAGSGCPCTSRNCPRRSNCQECLAHYEDKPAEPFCFRARTKWDKRCAEIAGAR